MNNLITQFARLLGLAAACLALGIGSAAAAIVGLPGPSFSLIATTDYISTADGQSIYNWGYANANVPVGTAPVMQYPGPSLIVNQGDVVTVTLSNQLPVPTSIVFPGQEGVTANGGTTGLLANEVPAGGSITYTFTASRPGTYMYHSGTRPDLQVEMGLLGALIVRPAVPNPSGQAYEHADSAFDYEYLFLLTEMDARIHHSAMLAGNSQAKLDAVDTSNYFSTLWFINGRNGPDTLQANNYPVLPNQPYNAVARAHPGDKVLLRLIGGGHDLHPFHHHGNNSVQIARDGRLLASAPGMGADLANSNYTIAVAPGSTYDAIFTWTGKGLGWDIFDKPNHTCTPDANGFDPISREWCADHGKPYPVIQPEQLDLANGTYWSGSPYLGSAGDLQPGQGGFNANAGYFFMWHSHTEKELTNDDIFPGGMMTMFIVEPVGVSIE